MANLQHLKASRTKVLKTFPSNSLGNDGDIIISMIPNKGTYLCTKAGGMWHSANKMKSLNNLGKTGSDSFVAKNIQIKSMKNAITNTDKFVVLENNNLKYRNSSELLDDLDSDALSINYKTSYCSLGQYNNKEECKAGGGTWYYSENDSHDSLTNVAENELLTVGSSIGKVDAESTLTYDGSTLEIKYNSEFDDNWYTSAQTNLLKLSYDSSNYATFDIDSKGATTIATYSDGTLGSLRLVPDGDLIIQTDENTGQVTIDKNSTNTSTATNIAMQIDHDHTGISASGQTITNIGLDVDLNSDSPTMVGTVNNFGLDIDVVAAQSGTQTAKGIDIAVSDADVGTGIQITMDGNAYSSGLRIDSTDATAHIRLAYDTNDYATFAVVDTGDLTIKTYGDGTTDSDLTLDVDGDILMDAAGGDVTITSADVSIAATKKLSFDGGTHTYISESSDDVMRIVVGSTIMLQLDEANDLNTFTHSVRTLESLFLTEQADALADVAGDGQIWIHNDAPNNLYFTDDDGTDINISRPYHTAVWGGGLARTTASGIHYAIPTGHPTTNIGLGTGTNPDTTLTCGTNADDITTCVWFSLNAIKVVSCSIMTGQGGSTNTGHGLHLMRYDIDADGDWSNGVVVGSVVNLSSDDYSQARMNTLTMSLTAANLLVSTSQILVGTVEPAIGYNTAMAAKVCIKYQEVQ